MQDATVFLIDSDRLFREGLKRLLEDSPLSVDGQASTLNEAVTKLTTGADQPDLILLDLPTVGEQEIATLQSLAPKAHIVLLSATLEPQRLAAVLRAGAKGFLIKNIGSNALLQSLQLVLLGEKVLPTGLSKLFLPSTAEKLYVPTLRKGLSQREEQILRHLVDGHSNKMIASQLGITEATVKVHLKGLLRKISASNRTQAAIWAMNNGLGNGSSFTAST